MAAPLRSIPERVEKKIWVLISIWYLSVPEKREKLRELANRLWRLASPESAGWAERQAGDPGKGDVAV